MSDGREVLAILGEKELELARLRNENEQLRTQNEQLNREFSELRAFVMNAAKSGKPISFIASEPPVAEPLPSEGFPDEWSPRVPDEVEQLTGQEEAVASD